MRAFWSCALVVLLTAAFSGCGGGEVAGGPGDAPMDDGGYSGDSSGDDSLSSDDSTIVSDDSMSSDDSTLGSDDSTIVNDDSTVDSATPDDSASGDPAIDDSSAGTDGGGLDDGTTDDTTIDGESQPAPKPRAPPPPPKPQTYDKMAIEAFKEGDQQKAMEHIYAHALYDPQAGSRLSLGWIPALKRPVVAERWAIGITFNQAQKYNGPPAEFGKAVPQVGNQGGGERRTGFGRRPNQPRENSGTVTTVQRDPPKSPGDVVRYFAGTYGDKLLARIRSAISAGGMGEVLRIAPAPIVKEVQPVDDAVADVDPALAGGDVDPALDGGNVDPALDGGNVDPAGVDGVDSQPAPLAPRTMAAYTGAAAISQGVSLVGVGPRNTLLERSRECGVDVLLVVRVSSLLTAKGQLNTSIEMELVDGQSGNMLKKSKEVNNLEYFFAKENPRAKDPVEESLDDFFKYVAENLQLQAMPELQPVHAAGRVGVIVAEERPKPLSLLAEMLYYRNQKLISDEQLAAACGKLIGEAEGKQLVSGRPEEKKFVLDRLLNSHVSSGVEPGEIDFFAEPASSGE